MLDVAGFIAGMILATTFIHAGFMFAGISFVQRRLQRKPKKLGGTLIVALFVFLMFVASVLEALIWALVYVDQQAIADLSTALYFSMVTFTTLGYGDIVLENEWRLVASFQASVGLIMFGWTTALVVNVVDDVFGGDA